MVTRIQYQVTGHAGLPGLSTLHFIGDADAAGAETIVGRLQDFWTAVADKIRTGTTITMTGVATIIDDQTGNVIAQHPTSTPSIEGGGLNEQLPRGTQGLLLLRSGVYVGGRELRGRMFIPAPIRTDNTSGGLPSATYLAECENAADTNLWAPPDFQLCVYSVTYLQVVPLSAIQGSAHWARLSTRQR